MRQYINTKENVASRSATMEADTILKNGENPKSLKSRGKPFSLHRFKKTFTLFVVVIILLSGCDNVNKTINPEELFNVIGQPDNNGGNGAINYWCDWYNKNISITYNSKITTDMSVRIHHISIY